MVLLENKLIALQKIPGHSTIAQTTLHANLRWNFTQVNPLYDKVENMRWYGMILGSLLSFGCSTATPPNLQASDYNQTCKVDADCTLIDEGTQCCAGCGNAAINVTDSAKYAADLQRRSDACKNPVCIAVPCVYTMAYCHVGKCDVCHGGDCPSTTDGGVKD